MPQRETDGAQECGHRWDAKGVRTTEFDESVLAVPSADRSTRIREQYLNGGLQESNAFQIQAVVLEAKIKKPGDAVSSDLSVQAHSETYAAFKAREH